MKKLLLILVLLGFSAQLSAQKEEYIVTFKNDTIYGDIKEVVNINSIYSYNAKFKIKNAKGAKKIIKPDEVQFVSLVDKSGQESFYVSISNSVFLKRVLDGRIKLYLLTDKTRYYIAKDQSGLEATCYGAPFSRKKSHLHLQEFLKDKPEILKEFHSLKGSIKNIKYIIKKYNDTEI